MASFATRFDSLEVPDNFPPVSELSAIRHIIHNIHALSALRQCSYTQLSNSELRPEITMTATKTLDTIVCFSFLRFSDFSLIFLIQEDLASLYRTSSSGLRSAVADIRRYARGLLATHLDAILEDAEVAATARAKYSTRAQICLAEWGSSPCHFHGGSYALEAALQNDVINPGPCNFPQLDDVDSWTRPV